MGWSVGPVLVVSQDVWLEEGWPASQEPHGRCRDVVLHSGDEALGNFERGIQIPSGGL